MAWYEINYTCGHQGREQLYGPHRQRENKIEYLERGVCRDCFVAQRNANNKDIADKAETATPGLPDLKGTERQVPWARTIRAKAIENIKMVAGETQDAEVIEFCKRMLRQDSATYWIDRRDTFSNSTSTASYIRRRIAEEKAKEAGKAVLGL